MLSKAVLFLRFLKVNKASTGSEEEGDEPAPPEPFEWREDED